MAVLDDGSTRGEMIATPAIALHQRFPAFIAGGVVAACLTGCAATPIVVAEASEPSVAQASENASEPAVWLTVQNQTEKELQVDLTKNCDDTDSRSLTVGQAWEGTGTCRGGSDVYGSIGGLGGLNATARPNDPGSATLNIAGCTWRVNGVGTVYGPSTGRFGQPGPVVEGHDETWCEEHLEISGESPVGDSRYHWTVRVKKAGG